MVNLKRIKKQAKLFMIKNSPNFEVRSEVIQSSKKSEVRSQRVNPLRRFQRLAIKRYKSTPKNRRHELLAL